MGGIWTIGHWTCAQDTFLQRLHAAGIEVLADVRAHPGSRRSPQFGSDALPEWLAPAGIRYLHLPELGGRRARQDVPAEVNAGWTNASFHNYADHTLGPAYRAGIERLERLASEHRVVIMCAEPLPWRCHRQLISTTLTARGWTVRHLIGDDEPRVHELGRWGATPHVDAHAQVTYPRTDR